MPACSIRAATAWLLVPLALAGCAAPVAAVRPTQTPYVVVVTATPAVSASGPAVAAATPVSERPVAAAASSVAMTPDERYLVNVVGTTLGESDRLGSWYSGFDNGSVALAQLEQQALQESYAVRAETQPIVAALQPVTDPTYRCFGRVAIDGVVTDAQVAVDLANMASLKISGTPDSGPGSFAAHLSSDLPSAMAIDRALRGEVDGLARGTALPGVDAQYSVLANAPLGGIASALGCNPPSQDSGTTGHGAPP